ncbi:gag-protease polyprotein [Cucumis melo var. makuwa]|uniref:Gag-protease polyprotein n=1 Tax=Cucumis melo var. makuwa TaxID=1194695 RepID=A0A5D3BKP1_CUCMM|nr:gag-protease polyprotein [Cucumis melo var. makuwa]TYK00381.1 gag-protease polyprotein [Cucumis melo var. makuwa]
MIVEQYDVEFNMLSCFAPDVVRDEAARTEKFVRAMDMSVHKRANLSKTAGRRSTPSQTRKIEQQPTNIALKDSSSGSTFRRHQQEVTEVGGTIRELPSCCVCGRNHSGHCLVGKRIFFKCKREGHLANKCPKGVAATNLQGVEKATHK